MLGKSHSGKEIPRGSAALRARHQAHDSIHSRRRVVPKNYYFSFDFMPLHDFASVGARGGLMI